MTDTSEILVFCLVNAMKILMALLNSWWIKIIVNKNQTLSCLIENIKHENEENDRCLNIVCFNSISSGIANLNGLGSS